MAEDPRTKADIVQPEKQPSRDENKGKPLQPALSVNEYLLAGVSILALTGAAWLLQPFTGYQSTALLYLLLVVALGLKLSRGPVLAVATTSAVLWNFLFVPPRFTFYIQKFDDGIMFVA